MTDKQSGAASVQAKAAEHAPNIVTNVLTYVGEIAVLLGQSLRYIVRGRVNMRDLMQQMSFMGVNSVAIALLTCFSSGAVLALYFAQFLVQYGQQWLVGAVVALALSREIAPVLVGVVVAARAGSAIAAEIGTMKVTEQVDALRALAVDPVEYLVPPRLISGLIMLPIVCALADAAGLFGGYLVSVYMEGVPAGSFPLSIRQFIDLSDFTRGLVKTVFFGLIIVLVGCHQGLRTRGGATEVGRATTNAVVLSIVFIYIADFFLAKALFMGTINP